MAEKLTTLAKRLRPFINGQIGAIAATGAYMQEGPGIDLVGNTIGLGGDTILLYKANGTPVQEFPATMAGINAAHAAAASGDRIVFPTITIACTAGVTIPAGVAWYYAKLSFSGFTGTAVTMNSNSSMDQCSVSYNGAGQANATGVSALDVEFAYLNLSTVTVFDATNNTGIYARGNAYGEGVVLKSSGAQCWNGTNSTALLLEEYTYAIHAFGETAAATGSNIGINLRGDVSGYTNAPQVISSWAWAQDGSSQTYGVKVDASKYGTLVNSFSYAIPGGDPGVSTGLNVEAGATLYCGSSTWNDLTGTGTIVHLRGCDSTSVVDTIIVNPNPGTVDECVVRYYLDGKIYWSSHRTGAGTNIGYEYLYNTVTGVNSELDNHVGQAGWLSVYNASDGLIYVAGQVFADAIPYRAAVWTINVATGAVTYYYLNALGEATGDVNELIGIIDDGLNLVAGERAKLAGDTTGSDYPNGGGLWTIPKATIGTPASYTRVYEDTDASPREWRNIIKYGSTYVALLNQYATGAYVIQTSPDLTNWTVVVDGSALALNDIRVNMIYHAGLNRIYAVTVNASRQVVLRWYDGSSWSSATFPNLTVQTVGMAMLTLATIGQDLILMNSDWAGYTHDIYLIFDLDSTPNYLNLARDVSGAVGLGAIEVGSDVYYCTCYPGGLNRIRLWDSETGHDAVTLDADAATILDITGQVIGLDTQAANTVLAGPTSGAANEPTFRALALSNGDISDVNITGDGQGDILYNNSGTYEDYPLGIGTKVSVTSNKIRFGNSAGGNYLEIDLTTGNLRLVGDATAWDDLRVSASIAKPGATAPSYKAFGPSGSLQALMFEASHHDEVYFEIQMPHNWKEGTNIHPHVHWSPVNTTAGNVVWELEYSWANINGTFGAPGNMATAATAAGGVAWVHKMSDLSEGGNDYIVGTGKTISSMLICRLHRNSNAGNDTLNQDVALLEFDLHYEVDSFGSDTELVKDTTSAMLLETGDYLLLENGDNILLE